MSLTSSSFFLFLLIAVILYYALRGKLQKYVLLLASIVFYMQVVTVNRTKILLVLAYVVLVTYFGALFIDRCKGKIRTFAVIMSVGALAGALSVLKYVYNLAELMLSLFQMQKDVSWLHFAPIMGISYFTLSAIGYLVDVYWETYKAEKNPFKIGLFILYFPQVISGPVTRYPQMKTQFEEGQRLEYQNIAYGIRRMAWGYFKKLVISERFAIVKTVIFTDYSSYSGVRILFAAICFAVQLYTDFSGCMDIVLGASQLFGIKLPENFNGPFLSRTVQEFWQRWHITLGQWFKDYVMYPIQISKPFVKLGRVCKKRFGKNIGKKIPMHLAMFILWFLIGLWHGGTAVYFVASAFAPCILMILSDWLQPVFTYFIHKWHINTDCFSYRMFQRIRTALLICGCWIFICADLVRNGFQVLKHMVTNFIVLDAPAASLGLYNLSVRDVELMIGGILLLVLEHYCLSKKLTLFEAMDKQNKMIKYAVIYAEILLILFFGMVGNSTFIYFKF